MVKVKSLIFGKAIRLPDNTVKLSANVENKECQGYEIVFDKGVFHIKTPKGMRSVGIGNVSDFELYDYQEILDFISKVPKPKAK